MQPIDQARASLGPGRSCKPERRNAVTWPRSPVYQPTAREAFVQSAIRPPVGNRSPVPRASGIHAWILRIPIGTGR